MVRHREHLQAILDTRCELRRVTSEWHVVPLETTIARVATSSRDLLDAIENCIEATPVGVSSIDKQLNEALALAWQGTDLLAALPLDVEIANARMKQANPLLGAAFVAFDDAVLATRRAGGPQSPAVHPG